MNKTEKYRQQLKALREAFYSRTTRPSIKEIMEFGNKEIYLVKKMNGKW
tara:strand:+ start:2219 stop:2365 length:147 start_codon:yes stop_codon:yes gene_type:complete